MDWTEFVKQGYLAKVNLEVLHPLGLALSVIEDDETGICTFGGFVDKREDHEGLIFDVTEDLRNKLILVAREQAIREAPRFIALQREQIPALGVVQRIDLPTMTVRFSQKFVVQENRIPTLVPTLDRVIQQQKLISYYETDDQGHFTRYRQTITGDQSYYTRTKRFELPQMFYYLEEQQDISKAEFELHCKPGTPVLTKTRKLFADGTLVLDQISYSEHSESWSKEVMDDVREGFLVILSTNYASANFPLWKLKHVTDNSKYSGRGLAFEDCGEDKLCHGR